MSSSDREMAGQRIARARRRRGLAQAVLAGLVGRSESWLSQVERGKRGIDSHSVLVCLAEVLRVDIEELTGSGSGDEPGRRVHPAAALIEQAMMAYGVPGAPAEREEPDREISLDYLSAKARSAYQSYQATRYGTTGRILPGLIRGAETAARSAGAASPAACGVRVLVYDTAAALLSRVSEPFLAWAAADRARSAAEYAGDPLLAAVSAWRLSYMITGRKHPQEALGLAMTAAAALQYAMRAPLPEQLSVYGALHLAAATAAAACYDRATTEAALTTARGIADRTARTHPRQGHDRPAGMGTRHHRLPAPGHRRRHRTAPPTPGQTIEPLLSAEPAVSVGEPDGKLSETATRIRDLAAQDHAFRERVDRRQRPMTPRENLDGASLGDTLPSWWAPHPDAILRPPKPEITPSATILQRAAEHDAELEAGG